MATISQVTGNPHGSASQSVKDGERRACPLSFAQSRLWILDRFQPGNPAYNIATSVPLYGRVDAPVLERTINEIVRRHEALRTTFEVIDGQPAQVVKASLKLQLEIVDLRSRSGVARREDVSRFIYTESRRPFDLRTGPLLHASLVRLDSSRSFLMLVMHHIVSDGWSMAVLNRELTTIYMAFLRRQPSPLPELEIQYPDFAVWQADWFRGELLQKQLGYWRKQLSGLRPVLNLPTDRRRPTVQTSNGSVLGFTLDQTLCEALKTLGNASRASLFMTLLAAFKVLLHRLSGETDIAVGSPIANRTRSELEGLIGFFVNTLVLRTDLSGDPSFVDLLVRERDVALDAYGNQDMPFEKLVDELQLDRDLGHNPFFQILFGVQNIGTIDRSAAPIQPLASEIQGGPGGNGTAKFDLTMSVLDTGSGAQGFLEFNTDLFDISTAQIMIERYIALLHRIVENPNERLSRLSIWIAGEVVDTAQPADAPEAVAAATEVLPERIAAHAADSPTALATIDPNGTCTYFELNQRANRIARTSFLGKLSAGSTVAFASRPGSGGIAVILAILKAGLVWAPIDPADILAPGGIPLSSDRAERILEALRPALVVVDEATEPCFRPLGVEMVRLDEILADSATQPDGELTIAVTPDSPAVMLARSDGTAKMTAEHISHRMLGRAGRDPFLRLSPEDRVAHLSNIGSDCARYELFGALAAGAAIVFVPPELSFRSRSFAALLQETSVTVMTLALADLERLAREFPRALRSVRLVLSAERGLDWGQLQEALPPEIIERIHLVSGDPAAGGFYLIQPLALLEPDAAVIPLGIPAAGVRIDLLGCDLEPVPARVPGNLYVHDPDLLDEPGYRTDDFARLEGGRFVLHGDREDALLTGHLKTRFAEIEAALCDHPSVEAAAVAARSRQGLHDRGLVAFVKLSREVPVSELQSFFAARMPARLMPSMFELKREIPYDSKGGIDRPALAAIVARLDAPMSGAEEYVAPRDNLEIHLTQIWMDVLHTDLVGIRDNFFRLGGHSLIATQIVARISDTLQIELPLQRLFEAPTIEQLAAVIKPLVGSGPQPQVSTIARVARDQPIPLSFAQQRLWFLDQFDPESAVYNIALPVRFAAPVDAAVLEGALNDLIERHETLRTTFDTVADEPVQIISPHLKIKMPIHDLRKMPEESRKIEMQRLVTRQTQMPFDLKHGPVLRAELIRLRDNDNIFLLTIHHIAADGWSMDIISNELIAFYEARRSRRPASLPDLPIQYADFACWQRRYLSGPVLQRDVKYWKDKLQGLPPLLELPSDRPRPAVQSFTGGMYMFAMPPSLLKSVKNFSAEQQVTLFTTLLSAFYILLHRYTGREDLVVGSPIANRVRPELEGLIGFITNTLVLRTQIGANATFRTLVSEVRDVTMAAFSHQGIPFERLVEEIQPDRNLSYNPLFQVMFALQNTGRPMAIGGVHDEDAPTLSAGVSKFDLTMFLSETASDLRAGIEYNSDLFDLSSVERLAGHYGALLAAALDEPDRPIWSLPMLLPAETTALADWNDTEDPTRSEICHVLFEKQAALLADQVALVAGEEKTSYKELNTRANALAHRLTGLGVGPGSRVAICIERGVDMIVALIATLKAGAAYVPIDPAYPKERIAYMAADAHVALVLTQTALRSELSGATGAPLLVVDDPEPAIPAHDNPVVPVSAGSLAYVIYTSGSTGKPKGVAMPHGPLASLIRWQIARSALPVGAPTLQFASLSFDVSFQEIFSTLGAGGTLVLITEEQRRDPPALWKLLYQQNVRRLFLPYVALQQLAEHARHAGDLPHSLKEIVTAGEQLQVTPQIAAMSARLGADLYNQYGPSESHVVTELRLTGTPSDWPARPSIGRVLPNTMIRILDSHGQNCPIGIPGELCIGGSALAQGYLEQPALTAERFVPDGQGARGGRLYRTGDRARFMSNGEIEFLGRSDQQVKIRGFRVELGEIEVALRTHPSVREAVVVARESRGELRLLGYIQADPESPVSTEDLRAHLRAILPEQMIPATYVIVGSLPLTPSGKLSRSNLPDPQEETSHSITGAIPRTPVEIALARLWSEILQVQSVGIKDNFFELGGHSLLATRVISRIRDEFGAELPVRLMFDNPTIEALALATVESMLEKRGDDQIARLLAELEQMPEEAVIA